MRKKKCESEKESGQLFCVDSSCKVSLPFLKRNTPMSIDRNLPHHSPPQRGVASFLIKRWRGVKMYNYGRERGVVARDEISSFESI